MISVSKQVDNVEEFIRSTTWLHFYLASFTGTIDFVVSFDSPVFFLSFFNLRSVLRNIGLGTSEAAAAIGSFCSPYIVYLVSFVWLTGW